MCTTQLRGCCQARTRSDPQTCVYCVIQAARPNARGGMQLQNSKRMRTCSLLKTSKLVSIGRVRPVVRGAFGPIGTAEVDEIFIPGGSVIYIVWSLVVLGISAWGRIYSVGFTDTLHHASNIFDNYEEIILLVN